MKMTKFMIGALVALVEFSGNAASPDPLDMCWTFGAHEPYTMYRRMGVRSTGGIYGNAYWLRDWFTWWDSEACPRQMEALGLDWLLCRYYKGMGWEEEKKDFPNVQRFVSNCRKHGVKPIAYVQFSTFYPETMRREIPDLEDWASRKPDGSLYYYSRYFRWEPCFNEPKFEEYLKKIIRRALTEAEFEGIFFDNAYMKPCYCKRCLALFKEHLKTIKNPADRFGFDSLEGFELPSYAGAGNSAMGGVPLPWGEVREPLLQEFNVWRTQRMTALFRRFYDYAHSVRPDCVVAANLCPYRAPATAVCKSVDMMTLPKCFDLVMGQVENCPHLEGEVIVNRVRDLKYACEFPATYFASCDGAAGDSVTEDESFYLLPLLEDAVFGGVPADRTIMAPYADPAGGFINRRRLARREPQLQAFHRLVRDHRAAFAAKDWMPLRFVVSQSAMLHSEISYRSLAAAEAVALRAHLPFGYALSTEADPLPHADEAGAMIVANQTCLSDGQVSALVNYAKRGGRLVVTGESGRYDEWNRQRATNPLKEAVKGLPNVAWRDRPDQAEAVRLSHIAYAFRPPKEGVKPLLKDLSQAGWVPPVEVVSAPETVFAQFKMGSDGAPAAVHLLNYEFKTPQKRIRLRLPAGAKPRFCAPIEPQSAEGAPSEIASGIWELPPFVRYARIDVVR